MSYAVFDEMKRFVRFSSDDEALLLESLPMVQDVFQPLVELFYERIKEHPRALAVMRGPEQVARLKLALMRWLQELMSGPWDDAYYDNRARIGRKHVEVELPQEYTFAAMNVIRSHLCSAVVARDPEPSSACRRVAAIDKVLDLELMVMLHTYMQRFHAQLRQRERLATFGQLSSTIAHELRNPLGVVESSAYLMRRHVPEDEQLVRHLDKIQTQVGRANRIITSLLDLVRDRMPRRIRIAADELVRRAVAASRGGGPRGLEIDLAQGLPDLRVDPEQMQQVLVNLLDNATDAAGPDGRVRLTVHSDGSRVSFAVEDSGDGVDERVAARLFEPLVTAKESGVGLGLALCKKLVEAHGGEIAWDRSSALGGARFHITLPLQGGEPLAVE